MTTAIVVRRSRRRDLALFGVSVLTALTLGWPLVTPFIAVAGGVPALLICRRNPSGWLRAALVLFALAFFASILIDLLLLGAGTTAGTVHPGPLPHG
jgi:hypothetical protein